MTGPFAPLFFQGEIVMGIIFAVMFGLIAVAFIAAAFAGFNEKRS